MFIWVCWILISLILLNIVFSHVYLSLLDSHFLKSIKYRLFSLFCQIGWILIPHVYDSIQNSLPVFNFDPLDPESSCLRLY